jgi:nitroimidazol reductase NimA-like FMN-containing flavoprotein (pyridoxamine 5'-phosphate oxidase superfamily)
VDRNALEVLSRDECLRLMAQVPIGRVAVVVGSIPVVVPVNFALYGDDIVFRTGTGTKLLAALGRSIVSFEADAVDKVNRSGWSVLVTGKATEITRPDELEAVDALGLESWVEHRHHWVRIHCEIVTGRRVRGLRSSPAVPETDWDWG